MSRLNEEDPIKIHTVCLILASITLTCLMIFKVVVKVEHFFYCFVELRFIFQVQVQPSVF